MTSTLTLAQKLQAKSKEQAQILEQAQASALEQLKQSMTKSLSESETIIKSATDSLSSTAESLSQSQNQLLQQMQNETDQTLRQYQAHLTNQLNEQQQNANELMTNHAQMMLDTMHDYNESVTTIIREQAKPYLITALIAVAIVLILGILFGLVIAKILS